MDEEEEGVYFSLKDDEEVIDSPAAHPGCQKRHRDPSASQQKLALMICGVVFVVVAGAVVLLVITLSAGSIPNSGSTDHSDQFADVTVLPANSFMHITDTHADPFYDIKYLWCGKSKLARPVHLQDSGKVVADSCNNSVLVEPTCPNGLTTPESIVDYWRAANNPTGRSCPCGVFGTNPPFQLLAQTTTEIKNYVDWGGRAVFYTGDFASHYEPGTMALAETCEVAKNVLFATVDMFDSVNNADHLYVMGNNDVFPKRSPVTYAWLHQLGNHLLLRGWLSMAERETWELGGFFKRQINSVVLLCAIGLNSNLWTPTQINTTMAQQQIDWLPGALLQDDTCNKFIIVSHIAVGATASSQYGTPPATNTDDLWGTDKMSAVWVRPVRDALDRASANIVTEVAGDLNTEHYYLTSNATWGFTGVGVSRRGGNDPGLQIVELNKDGTKVVDVLSYQMSGEGCSYALNHSFVEQYQPYFNNGIDAAAVYNSLLDSRLDPIRLLNSHRDDSQLTKAMMTNETILDLCRTEEMTCC